MSSRPVIQTQNYVERLAVILESLTGIFPDETDGTHLVTGIHRNKPAVIQAPDDAILPYIAVFESDQPIRFLEKAGRDGRNIEGGSVYLVEIYCVLVTDPDFTAEEAQKFVNNVTQIMRDGFANNLRLTTPGTLDNPLCRTHSRYQVPYILRGEVPPTMKAMNVVIRAEVYVSPRG